MEFDFYKLQVAANDFIVVNTLHNDSRDPAAFEGAAKLACPRKLGVGAAGIVFIVPGVEHRIRCMVFSPHGTEIPVCFDALSCAAKYALDSGLGEMQKLVIETPGGPIGVEMLDSVSVRLDLGSAQDRFGVQLARKPNADPNTTVSVDGRSVVSTLLQLRRLYATVFDDRRSGISRSECSKNPVTIGDDVALRVNARLYNRDELAARCHFPGETPDFTEASAAAAVAAILNDFCESTVAVNIRRSTNYVQWDEKSGNILVTAAPRYVFTGSFYYEQQAP